MNVFNKKGFTLIEIIVSITLIGLIAIFILSMSVYGLKFSKWNNIKLNSLNLAHTQIEWLKTYEYDNLGLDKLGHDPIGTIHEYKYMNRDDNIRIENVEYKMHTNIYWVGNTSTTGEPVPDALKGIDVIVEAKDLFSGKTKTYSVLGTMVTREHERNISEPGQLTVYTYFRDMNTQVNRVELKLNNGRVAYSNVDGRAFFANLNADKYFVEPLTWKGKEIIAQPRDVDSTRSPRWIFGQTANVKNWASGDSGENFYPELSFYIDFPGYILLPENSTYPNDAKITIGPSTDSYNPPEGVSSNHLFLTMNISQLKNLKFWRLWKYEYKIEHNDDTYFLINKDHGNTWDNIFSISNIEEPSYEKLELGFALADNGSFQLESGKIKKINLEFTSEIENIKDMKFAINGKKIDEGYEIIQDKNRVTIRFNPGFHTIIDDNTIYFEITNGNILKNKYNMKLATDLSKSTLILNVKNKG